MSNGVPIWLAVSGAVVGTAAGSLGIVDWVRNYFAAPEYNFVERYVLVEIPDARVVDQDSEIIDLYLQQLRLVGEFSLRSNKTLNEGVANFKPKLEQICELAIASDNIDDCRLLGVFMLGYGVQNTGPVAFPSYQVELRRFHSIGEPLRWEDWPPTFANSAFEVATAKNECLVLSLPENTECSYKGSEETELVTVSQSTLPGEAIFEPLYFGISFSVRYSDGAGWQKSRMFIGDIALPLGITFPNGTQFPSRSMDRTPIIQAPGMQEFG